MNAPLKYHVHFVDDAGTIFAVDVLIAESDAQAKLLASQIIQSRVGAGFDIWRDGVLVHQVRY
jgi:hypothetical protein